MATVVTNYAKIKLIDKVREALNKAASGTSTYADITKAREALDKLEALVKG
jgi:hypothetical protein